MNKNRDIITNNIFKAIIYNDLMEEFFLSVLSLPSNIAYFVIFIWIFEGFALKFLDLYLDDGMRVSRVLLWIVIILAGLFAGIVMAIDITFSFGAVVALIVGVILAKKIDHRLWVYQILLVAGFAATLIAHSYAFIPDYYLSPLNIIMISIIVGAGTLLDEITHEMICRLENGVVFRSVFKHRLIMKVTVFVMVPIFPFIHLYHAFAWLFFDFTYDLTDHVFVLVRSKKMKRQAILIGSPVIDDLMDILEHETIAS
ncbi:MAG: hypothetical protein ACTSWN_07340 [Promethearchaeota archaeon]